MIRDGEDPYFVVAADKGTAPSPTSPTPSRWSAASGSAMPSPAAAPTAMTTRRWASPRAAAGFRPAPFRRNGRRCAEGAGAVAGCGDMSGDVFGNGMLLSRRSSWSRRSTIATSSSIPIPIRQRAGRSAQRLFNLPRSSWDDYDAKLISKGGGVFPAAMKEIPLSPEMRPMLALTGDARSIPLADLGDPQGQVDLLWFGGIGTYVKAASREQCRGRRSRQRRHPRQRRGSARQGYRRRCEPWRHAGRAHRAFALKGGRINTDFIDNSAGVDCSDNEVNIKIALNAEMAAGA
jgi:glutamate dehydrogenase